MTLRDEAITHMAQALYEVEGLHAEPWEFRTRIGRRAFVNRAEPVLDALLDFLDAHTEEWEDDAEVHWRSSSPRREKAWIPMIDNADRIAALRGTTEEQ